ncbi:myo-inositol-1(or 4)-monophosphatase [Saccharopolyspora antimicrobica]|uniref:Inositol-1-monophosphatase n=1 Tax=Saccharopolyspora antimicrobica TaxID=455193 RepID=A0A1I5HSC0_9PSEU|nr:inositol monophosphatase family protein [Saccharopolyspora antimicrobica]RKT82350.1 myo-inositol-1(or 4)-monophosphatase [Saccharopolyspora antimicrobica]SFO51195.1 myo-inositol-1(or 4)-monophosphatase [Saccharopolyspora antimicrobica]
MALREVAVQIAREAAQLARTVRDDAVTDGVDTKSTETDVVTAGDRAVERLVRGRLAELRPGESVLGEEEGGERALEGLRWVVDPIDGTVNYLYGFPWYSVSLAAQLDGRSVAGAVVEPASGRVWSAATGHGAFLDGRRLRVSAADRLDLSLIGTGFAYDVDRRKAQAAVVGRLMGQVRDIRRAGVASLDLCAVAAGWLDGMYEVGLKRWDWAAGVLIAEEAGARLRLPERGSADGLGDEMLICATPGIAEALTGALREADAGRV